MDITKDIWIYILSYLENDLKSLVSFTRVSKYFNILANYDSLWKSFCMIFKNNEINYKKEENWKQIFKINFNKIIKTLNCVCIKGDKRCYYFHENGEINKILLYDPKQKDKLLNIIDIYDDNNNYDDLFTVISDNNRIFHFSIHYLLTRNYIPEIYEIFVKLEKNDIIKNYIYTYIMFDFIIVQNLNNYKVYMTYEIGEILNCKLMITLKYNIIDVKFNDVNDVNDLYSFEIIYLDENNNKCLIEINHNEITKIINN